MWLRLLIVFGIIGLAEYYSFIVVRSAIRSFPYTLRTTVMVVYIICTALSWAGLLLFRTINWAVVPHMLRNIYIAFVLGFVVGKILVLLVMLVDDIRRLITWFVGWIAYSSSPAEAKPDAISRSGFLKTLALLLGGTTLAGFLYGVTNRYNYHVRRVKLRFAALPAAFHGLKIVQLSDIHTGSFDNHAAVAHGIQKAMEQKADLIFFTGDLVNNHSDEVDAQYQEIYTRLKAPLGVYSTLGNHDYGDYVQWPSPEAKKRNLEKLIDMHGAMGWRILMNEHAIIQSGNDQMAIIGVENWSAKANFPKYGDLAKAYEGLAKGQVPFKILLSHDPSHWDAQVIPQYGDIQLTLSGHTHGMQFGIESKWLKWSPVQYMYKQWAGLYNKGSQYLYVNRGFGFLGYPGRLGILPEITVFELS